MALPKQKFREIVFHLLYSQDFSQTEESDMMPFLMKELLITKKGWREANERKEQIKSHLHEIDQKIRTASENYAFERIPRVERNVLRLATFELFFDPEIPPKIAIVEAIRLSRKFATADAASFVNAILHKIHQEASLTLKI